MDAGAAGLFIPGRPLPVRVQVHSDRLISGRLVVTGGGVQLAQPVEISGGSAKQFELVLPTTAAGTSLPLEIALTEGGTRLVTAKSTVTAGPETEVVGLLPGLLSGQPLPGSAPLSVDVGTARFVAVTDADLALAPASLGPLSAVALGPEELGRLDPAVRQALLGWTAGGGRLLIDARPGDTVAALPGEWRPVGTPMANAGLGQVVFTGGAMAAGNWSGLVAPASHAGAAGLTGFTISEPLSNALATDAGFGALRLPWLLGFLALYIVVVGPIGFVIARRARRAEVLWIVIPAISVLFAGVSYVVGTRERAGSRAVAATVVDTTTGKAQALTYVGIVSSGESTSLVHAPTGWVEQRYRDPGNPFSTSGQEALTVNVVDNGVDGRLNLNAGQFALIQASGPAHFPGQLTVSAQATADGQAEGTVTNGTPFRLVDVAVLIGPDGVRVGPLAPGGKATWRLSAGPQGSVVEQQLWPTAGASSGFFKGGRVFVGPNGPDFAVDPGAPIKPSGPASIAVWEAAPVGLSPGTRPLGVAAAVGWTGEYRPEVTVGHHGVTEARTAVIGTTVVRPSGPGVPDLAVGRTVVRGDLQQVGPSVFVAQGGSGSMTVAWSLPPAAAGHQLSLALPSGTGPIAVWSAGGWRALSPGSALVNNGGGPKFGPSDAPLPPATLSPATLSPATGAPGAPGGPARVVPDLPVQVEPGVPTPVRPVPAPFPLPSPAGPFGAAVVTTSVSLGPADAHDGAVHVRIEQVSQDQPFSLDALALKVLP